MPDWNPAPPDSISHDDSLSILENGEEEHSDGDISVDSQTHATGDDVGSRMTKDEISTVDDPRRQKGDTMWKTDSSTSGDSRNKREKVIDLSDGHIIERRMVDHTKILEPSNMKLPANNDTFQDNPPPTSSVMFDLSVAPTDHQFLKKRPGMPASNRKKFGFSINADDDSDIENKMSIWLNAKQGISRLSTFRDGLMTKGGIVMAGNWFEYFGYTAFAIAIQLSVAIPGFGEWWFPDNDGKSCTPIMKPGDVVPSTDVYNRTACEILQAAMKTALNFKILAAFIIGGFVISSIKLWTDRRMRYRTLNGSIRSLLVALFSIIPADETDDQLSFDRATISRWCVLGYEIAILDARGQMDSEDGREYLESLNLLSKDEWEKMESGDRMTSTWHWILTKCKMVSWVQTNQSSVHSSTREYSITYLLLLCSWKSKGILIQMIFNPVLIISSP